MADTGSRSMSWLANAKKFNAQKIRRRMKEQQQQKENAHENDKIEESKKNLSLSLPRPFGLSAFGAPTRPAPQDSAPGTKRNKRSPPALTIAVTMSDDEDDEERPPPQSIASRLSDSSQNVSAWAMMENYQNTSKQDGASLDNNDIDFDASLFSQGNSAGLTQEGAENHSAGRSPSFAPGRSPSFASPPATVPTPAARIRWKMDHNGELLDASVYTGTDVSVTPLSTATSETFDTDLVRENDSWNDHRNSPTGPKDGTATATTPVHLRSAWRDQKKDDESSTAHSLMQESIINSVNAVTSVPKTVSHIPMANNTRSPGAGMERDSSASEEPSSPQVGGADVTAKTTYLARIDELEENLKMQKTNTSSEQTRLKDRVVELEQALRVTAATPRGTVIQENPLKTLLDRNQTLVKEVRFADQTCVELSAKLTTQEAKCRTLREQLAASETELDSARAEIAEKDNQIEILHGELLTQVDRDSALDGESVREADESRVSHENEFLGRQLGVVQQKLDETQAELEAERKRYNDLEVAQWQEKDAMQSQIDLLKRQRTNNKTATGSPPSDRAAITKEFSSCKLNVIQMQKMCEAFLSSGKCTVNEKALIELFQQSLVRMTARYEELDNSVANVVETYSHRMENLQDTISFLRDSLTFEIESVSTAENGHVGVAIPSHVTQHGTEEEDDELTLMEEARKPPPVHFGDDDTLSTLDHGSRAFHDDNMTTTSHTLGIAMGSVSDIDHLKKPLEDAVRDCQRVRTQSAKLAEQNEQQRKTIALLTTENDTLLKESNQNACALEKAELHLDRLLSVSGSVEDRIKALGNVAIDMQNQLTTKESNWGSKTRDLEEQQVSLRRCQAQLQDAVLSIDKLKKERDTLMKEMDFRHSELSQQHEAEMDGLRHAYRQSQTMQQDLQRLQQETLTKLALVTEEKLNLASTLANSEAKGNQLISIADDKMLEAQSKQEGMRRERAELRSLLSQTEKDVEVLSQQLTRAQSDLKEQVSRKEAAIEGLTSELSEIFDQAENLKGARYRLFDALESVDLGPELTRIIARSDNESMVRGDGKCAEEIATNADTIDALAKLIMSLSTATTDTKSLVSEVENLKAAIYQCEETELNQTKVIGEERSQSEKLFALLQQAEGEMERSATQIREMSEALSGLQEQEARAVLKSKALNEELLVVQSESQHIRQQFTIERSENQTNRANLTTAIQTLEAQLCESLDKTRVLESEVTMISQVSEARKEACARVQAGASTSEAKCVRLREFVQSLTTRCEEWETSFEKQGSVIGKLQSKNKVLRERVADASDKYRNLKEEVHRRRKIHNDDKAHWTAQKNTLHDVHARLEQEIELIAKELEPVDTAEAS